MEVVNNSLMVIQFDRMFNKNVLLLNYQKCFALNAKINNHFIFLVFPFGVSLLSSSVSWCSVEPLRQTNK